MPTRAAVSTVHFALCAVRHPHTGKWLCVNESRKRGWWIPGGGVERLESFFEAAVREVKEETGIDAELKGILRVEHSSTGLVGRMRVIFLGVPCDPSQEPKSEPDSESDGAAWLSVKEMETMHEEVRTAAVCVASLGATLHCCCRGYCAG
jgi:8-oxo-dGTP pyrophosphatase MutT (NUDIX family)